jgi:hypothetical protein
MADIDANEILKRLKELEEENARLRSVAHDNGPKPLTVKESDYKGHPVLTFEGPFRPFSLGLTKLTIIKQAWSQVDLFLSRHEQKAKTEAFYEDDKI